jgi:ABC-type amino acid transport substrate-binding protein
MVNTLLTKKVEAIVFDAPVLLFYPANEGLYS